MAPRVNPIGKKHRRAACDDKERETIVTAALYLGPRYCDMKTKEWKLLTNAKFAEMKRLLRSERTESSLRNIFRVWLKQNEEKWDDMKLEALANWDVYFAKWINAEKQLASLVGQKESFTAKDEKAGSSAALDRVKRERSPNPTPDEIQAEKEKNNEPTGPGGTAGHGPKAFFPKHLESADDTKTGGGEGRPPPPRPEGGGLRGSTSVHGAVVPPNPPKKGEALNLLAAAGTVAPPQVHCHGTMNQFLAPITINVKLDPGTDLGALLDKIQPSSINKG